MRALRLLAAVAISASLLGAAADPESVSPRDPYPSNPPGPTCYGGNYSYHVWNLLYPQDVYGVDSCRMAVLLAQRRVAGNLAMYISLVTARVPNLMPVTVMVMAWNTSTEFLSSCTAPGRGVEFLQSSSNGWMQGCQPQ